MSQESLHKGPPSEQQKELNEEGFLKELYLFMKNRGTPIERIPHLGFKQIDLFLMYKTVQNLGGYNQVTAHQLWKQVYNELGGNPRSTSAATCTRRHYEKLILPFEWHSKGEDEKDLPVTRPPKRSRFDSFTNEEEEVARGTKRGMGYGLRHASHSQDARDYLTDNHVRIIPVPMHFRQYFSHEHPSMAAYHPAAPIMQATHTHHSHQVSHLSSTQEQNEWPKKQLVLLRNLAKDYMSSSGWAEPLNLSCKEGGLDPLSQQPSSFTPTSNSNKPPRFLNMAFPLYPTLNIAKDEGSNGLVTETRATVSSSIIAQEQTVIDLSSTRSRNESPATASNAHASAFDDLSLQKYKLGSLDGACPKIPERTSPQLNEAEKPSTLPFSPPRPSFPQVMSGKELTDKMEIQIPLAVLQDLLKGKFGMPSQLQSRNKVLQSDKSPVSIGEARGESQENIEVLHAQDGPADLSIQDPIRETNSFAQKMNHTKAYLEKMRNPPSPAAKDRSLHSHGVNSFQVSLGIKAHDWKSLSECSSKFSQVNMAINRSTGSTGYRHAYTQESNFEAQKTVRNIQISDLMPDRGHNQAHSTSMWLHPRSCAKDHEKNRSPETGYYTEMSQSRAPRCRQVEGVSMAMPERRPTADAPAMLMVNGATPSLVPLTQEEYLKLRRLISSSP